jgi:zinc-binding alcohol dehydrogenase family protein
MKAITFYRPLPVSNPESLVDVTVERPSPGPRDLLVEVRAISVNPVDAKIRGGSGPRTQGDPNKLLGWDAAGIVREIGSEVRRFSPGDAVYYAGSIDRSGSYAEYQAVDERIVGRKPHSISFAEAAALPLTTITAWESIFDRLRVPQGNGADKGSLLIVGAAGGVGSMATQLARSLTGLTIIATASRPETQAWCLEMGAHHVVDHREPLASQVLAITPGGVNFVLALTKTEDHYEQLVEAMAPQSAMALIENVARPIDINRLKPKSISLHWEFMFGRPLYQTADMSEQGKILNEVARLVDAGQLRSTLREHLEPINAANLRHAHAIVESGKSIGKVVLESF